MIHSSQHTNESKKMTQAKFKTPAEVAAIFGCTPEQARKQLAANAAQQREMAAKAKATGKKVNGYTEDQLIQTAIAIEAVL